MPRPLSRRAFLAAAALGVAACSSGGSRSAASSSQPSSGSSSGGSSAGSSSASSAGGSTTTSEPTGGPARFVSTGTTGRNQVALTFHTNGDLGLFHQLADVLAAHKVVATSFMVGEWLDANPDLGKQLHDAGHELANHTYTHPDFAALSEAAMADEVARCRAAIANVVPGGGRLFRVSGTADGTSAPSARILSVAGAGGYPVVLGFDDDPLDYQDPGADAVASRAIAGLHDGAIVSLHFGHAGTVAALPRILDAVAAKGLTPVTASALLA